jgi:hypothetical protein
MPTFLNFDVSYFAIKPPVRFYFFTASTSHFGFFRVGKPGSDGVQISVVKYADPPMSRILQ